MQWFATRRLWCRLSVMIKATLISSMGDKCLLPPLSACNRPGCLLHIGQQWCRKNQQQLCGQPSPRCFHPHPSTGQMEIWIRSGRCCQLYSLKEELLREGHPSFLFLAAWNLWNELRRFSKIFRSLCLSTKVQPTSSTQGCCFSCWPQHKEQLIWRRDGDSLTNKNFPASGLAPLSFCTGQTTQNFPGKRKRTVLLNLTNPTFFSVKTVGLGECFF